MRLLHLIVVSSFLAVFSRPAAAQTATLPYDHVHLAAPDQARAVEWYQKMFGGQPTPEGKDRLMFGKTRFIWLKSDMATPSEGTAVDHIAFSVRDAYQKIRELGAAGVKIKEPLRTTGAMSFGFVEA